MRPDLPNPVAPALRRALWAGALPDPGAPAAALAAGTGADYAAALAALRDLARHGLPMAPALDQALKRWPRSIDLALVALQVAAPGDRPAALDRLARRVRAQNRRHAALARAWDHDGQTDRAIAHLAGLAHDCPTWASDTSYLVELLFHQDQPDRAHAALAAARPQLPPAQAARLDLLGAWLTGGAPALARAQDGTDPPADPGLWSWLLNLWLTARDLPRARAALDRLAALRPPDAPETLLDHARLALDSEAPDAARALLDRLPAAPPPDWPERRHILHLRSLTDLADRAPDPTALRAQALDHAAAALRLWPRNPVLFALSLTTAERAGDWDALAATCRAALADPARAPAALHQLGRLGLPAPDHPLAPATPQGARLTASLALLAGDPGAALRPVSARPAPPLTRARLAEPRAEAHLHTRDLPAARAELTAALALLPSHMGMVLQRARLDFLAGDFAAAEAALSRFRALKTAQTGTPPPPDLRDIITADALASGQTIPEGESPAATRSRLGPALAAHPGLAACWLARSGALPPFLPAPANAIPPRAALYWEGAMPAPVARGLDRWRAMLPGWTVTLHDAPTARAWLATHDPQALPAWDRLPGPAARADLFRACLLAREGGLFVDTDEYPRAPVTPWLDGASCVLVLESGYGTAANNFLATRPGLPLMAAFRARILDRLATTDTPYPWWDSGPAQLTAALAAALTTRPRGWPGLRILSQADYCARVTTNLPFPHKRRPDHWRQRGAPPLPPGPDSGQMPP